MTAGGKEAKRRESAALGAAGWLGLAAAPTFALMATLTYALGGDADMICAPMHGMSPLNGMAPMYALMSAFHAAPWLALISRRRVEPIKEGKPQSAA
jgi:hypothetical protein